jgi:hypothetical protein
MEIRTKGCSLALEGEEAASTEQAAYRLGLSPLKCAAVAVWGDRASTPTTGPFPPTTSPLGRPEVKHRPSQPVSTKATVDTFVNRLPRFVALERGLKPRRQLAVGAKCGRPVPTADVGKVQHARRP